MSKIVCIGAIVTTTAEKAAKAELALRECVAPSRAEAACRRYILSKDLSQEGRFALEEQWADEDGFQAHMKTPHFTQLVNNLKTLDARLDVLRLEQLLPL